MAGALSLLPREAFISAFAYLNRPINGESGYDSFNAFMRYLNVNYSKKNISVIRLSDRTNNCAEQSHATLKKECLTNTKR